MVGMAKAKVSVTLDRDKIDQARALVPTPSVSELIDLALDRLVSTELDRRHLAGYARHPVEGIEVEWAELPRAIEPPDDETDWASLYGLDPEE